MEAKGVDNAYISGTTKTAKARKGRVARTVAQRGAEPGSAGGSLVMSATEFQRFTECMTKPRKPSKAMVEAAKLHKVLTSSR